MLGAVAQIGYAGFSRAVVTAKHLLTAFQAMSNDANTAMRAGGCEFMDGAFEAVKGEGFTLDDHLKELVVIVSA